MRVTRNLPIKIICPNTRHRIINQVIYEEYIYALWNRRSNWTRCALERLLEYDIKVSDTLLRSYKRQIIDGSRDPVSVSNFSKDLFSGTYTSRYGKDGMYNQFYLWESVHLAGLDSVYVGLPANQILTCSRRYGVNTYACEANKPMACFMCDMQRHFSIVPYAKIINLDIFNFLRETNIKFSVFDFDLMCHINSEKFLDNISESIVRTSKPKSVVNIVTTIGRRITEKEYRRLMPFEIINKIEDNGFKVIMNYSGGYNDRIAPMRYEFLALERR